MNLEAELAAPVAHPWRNRCLLLAVAAIAVATAVCYWRSFSVPFLYDDIPTIPDNPTIRHLITAFRPPTESTARGRPILNLSLAINYALGGASIWTYHLCNLAIHILAALALFGIVRRTLVARGTSAAGQIAFYVALLWAVHPLQTEAVTYVVQRAESLMGLFYLVTLYCFIRAVGTGGRRRRAWFALSFFSCLLGMGTKEVMVSAPLMVVLYDRTFLAGSFREAFRRRWAGFALLACTWMPLAWLVRSAYGGSHVASYAVGITWWRYALTQLPAITHYVRLCFWPRPLIFDYGTALVPISPAILPCALLVGGLVAATVWALVARPAWGFLGFGFLAILAPTSSIVPVAGETMAEYRMYLPSIAIILVVVLAIHRAPARAAAVTCLAIAAVLSGATWVRNGVYRSEQSVWTDTVAERPDNVRARTNLGEVLAMMPGRLPDAIGQFQAALALNPAYAKAQNNLGAAFARMPGRLPEAIAHYEAALAIKPDYAKAHTNLGKALASIPARRSDAIGHYEAALRIDPGDAEAHLDLGNALADLPGRLPEAIAHLKIALKIDPDFAQAHNRLGVILTTINGRWPEAISHFRAAVKINPTFAEAHFNLACGLLEVGGHVAEARFEFNEAVRLRPDLGPSASRALSQESRQNILGGR